MIGAPVPPIPIGNRWQDSNASKVPPQHIDLSVVVAAQGSNIAARRDLQRCAAFNGGFEAALLVQQVTEVVPSIRECRVGASVRVYLPEAAYEELRQAPSTRGAKSMICSKKRGYPTLADMKVKWQRKER
jgi:hypothetical protein